MDHAIALVLDTTAIRSYMRGELLVGQRLSQLNRGVDYAFVPVLCLAEAYLAATPGEAMLLELLSGLPSVIVTTVNPRDAAVIAGLARTLGSHDFAHATLDALAHQATIITSERKVFHQVLPEGWPIIDV